MSKARKKFKKKREAHWTQLKRNGLAAVRKRLELGSDEVVPDDVLVFEVDHYLPTHAPNGEAQFDLNAREQWFSLRLLGLANDERDRLQLADALPLRPGVGRFSLGLDLNGPPRHSEHSGRQRTERRRQRLTSG
jgi:hypothetical protein